LGKADVIAKGVRKVRSRKAGHVELFARSSFVVSRVSSSWDIVSQAEMVEPHTRLRGDLVRGAYARYAVELLDGFFTDEQGGRALFELLGRTLDWLCERDDLDTTIRFYEQRLLGLAGFRPELYRCVGDHPHREPVKLDAQARNGPPFGLDSERGGLLCSTCYAEARTRQGVIPLSPHVLSFLRELQQGPFTRVAGQPVPPAVQESTERAMQHYITHHLERNVRSIAFLRQLRAGGGGSQCLDASETRVSVWAR
jgi:DNA repair protein RecO (recombination protein O)